MESRTEKLEDLRKALYIEEKRAKIKDLKEQLADEATWKDWEKGQSLSKDLANLEKDIQEFEFLELLAQDDNEEFDKEHKKLELKTFLGGAHDPNDAILTIHAGQGGTEAMDWSGMLYRMYTRYAERKNWQTSLISETPGEETGYKRVSFEINGLYAYGFLKNEAGVHRLVRQSPFNADSLRQTSFALVEIIPMISDNIDIEVKDEDVEFEAYRSGGKGGQNVNKVSTAVRIKHIPSGIIVECQEERYQGKNREKALKILKSKLYALELEKIEKEKKDLKGDYKMPGWGNQIRNYILHPYKLVKDLRTDTEVFNPDTVLDGDIDIFIDASLRQHY